ncbi:uncharacterized protein LOC107823382 [Nicotiana tabacum]|uniref:Myb-related protein 308 n=1 Tax=Nicotiana tabacum TaxID=4097 RepID=A0A1S4CWH7_TOBAC|nr:myb-related protein 308-like [Nicotiana tomentosiformis]XP_016505505.1 PREDICTED: myb-related protein 308-like [Nicotiana tabacum]
MGRAPCCAKEGLRKGPWSTKEDLLLSNYIKENGEGQWRNLPKKAGLLRCGKSCRLRWMNYLRPGIKRGNFSQDEEDLIIRLHSLLGNRWSLIAGRLPGRTDNEIKNYWNTHLIKKLKSAGIEPKVNKIFSKYCPKKEPKKQAKIEKPRKKQDKKKNKKKKDQSLVQNISDSPQVVFVPKPIRISSCRNHSVEDVALLSTSSSNSSEEADKRASRCTKLPLCATKSADESDHIGSYVRSLTDEEGKIEEVSFIPCATNLFDEVPLNENMLEKVYEEYLQLLSEKCYLQDNQLDDDLLAGNVFDHSMLM